MVKSELWNLTYLSSNHGCTPPSYTLNDIRQITQQLNAELNFEKPTWKGYCHGYMIKACNWPMTSVQWEVPVIMEILLMETPMNRDLIPLMFPGSIILQNCIYSSRWKVAISFDKVMEAWHHSVLDYEWDAKQIAGICPYWQTSQMDFKEHCQNRQYQN